jgi:polyhydroxybutyrate depolymerase
MRRASAYPRIGALAVVAITCGAIACGAAAGDPAATEAPAPAPARATGTTPAPSGSDASLGPAEAGAAPDCAGRVKVAGDFTWTFDAAGTKRTANVHVPLAYDPTARTPLVLNLHGYTETAESQASLSKMTATADREGFIVVYPQGVSNSWNAGNCCGPSQAEARDDVGFLGSVIDEAAAKLCVDPKRVFAAGMSNGAFMAHRLACELSDRIAAVGSVAGLMTLATCAPKRPVPVIQFHGTGDLVVPYAGNLSLGFPPVTKVIDDWAKRDGCTGDPAESFAKDDVRCTTRASCSQGSEVTLCTVTGGGHTWPGGTPTPSFGATTTALSASDALWAFFQKHPMP